MGEERMTKKNYLQVKTIQRNVPENVKDKRKREYMECKKRVEMGK